MANPIPRLPPVTSNRSAHCHSRARPASVGSNLSVAAGSRRAGRARRLVAGAEHPAGPHVGEGEHQVPQVLATDQPQTAQVGAGGDVPPIRPGGHTRPHGYPRLVRLVNTSAGRADASPGTSTPAAVADFHAR